MSDIWLLYSTFASRDEALSVARSLLEARLVACANVHESVTSLYRWEGEVRQETETVLLAKTQKAKLAQAMDEVKRLHSYEVPCIIAYPAGEAFLPFLQWVAEGTS